MWPSAVSVGKDVGQCLEQLPGIATGFAKLLAECQEATHHNI